MTSILGPNDPREAYEQGFAEATRNDEALITQEIARSLKFERALKEIVELDALPGWQRDGLGKKAISIARRALP